MTNLIQESKKYNIVWIGEIHGIKENYLVYKEIIPQLAENGFKNILWEMQSDFSTQSPYSEDGRINPFSIDLLKWINSQISLKNLDSLTLFGDVEIKTKNSRNGDDERAEKMADHLIEALDTDKKYVVISGNYHMRNTEDGEARSCLEYVEKKTKSKILKIEITYAGGTLYNFGIMNMPEKDALEFGTITKSNDKLLFHAGKAHEVFKNPTT